MAHFIFQVAMLIQADRTNRFQEVLHFGICGVVQFKSNFYLLTMGILKGNSTKATDQIIKIFLAKNGTEEQHPPKVKYCLLTYGPL